MSSKNHFRGLNIEAGFGDDAVDACDDQDVAEPEQHQPGAEPAQDDRKTANVDGGHGRARRQRTAADGVVMAVSDQQHEVRRRLFVPRQRRHRPLVDGAVLRPARSVHMSGKNEARLHSFLDEIRDIFRQRKLAGMNVVRAGDIAVRSVDVQPVQRNVLHQNRKAIFICYSKLFEQATGFFAKRAVGGETVVQRHRVEKDKIDSAERDATQQWRRLRIAQELTLDGRVAPRVDGTRPAANVVVAKNLK